jgi:hypothetical protein
MPPKVFDDGGNEPRALGALGALPAWSGVLERHRLLARREQAGILAGLLVEHEGTLHLVDESVGMGTLAIPVELPTSIRLVAPARVLLWGAWHLDQAKHFVWRATRVETLSPLSSTPEFAPGLVPRDKEAPEAPLPVSEVTRKGGRIWFQVHEKQGRVGDGWLVSEGGEGPPVARILLPGEQDSYGDQSRVTDSERWKLKKGHFYWLEIGRFRPPTDGSLPVFRARTPPFRYSEPAVESSP